MALLFWLLKSLILKFLVESLKFLAVCGKLLLLLLILLTGLVLSLIRGLKALLKIDPNPSPLSMS